MSKERITALRQLATERYILSTLPTLYLPLWKRDGSTFLRDDGSGTVCTVTGALWTPQGRSFDIAHDDVINIPDSSLWNISSNDFTISLWVKHSELGVVHHYVSQGIDNNYYWFFRKESDNTISCTYKNGDNTAANRINIAGIATLNANTFYYVTISKIGTTWQLYINGVADGVTTQSVSAGDFAHTLEIGAMTWTGNASMYGVIGEVLLYSRGLTSVGNLQNYLATKWRYR